MDLSVLASFLEKVSSEQEFTDKATSLKEDIEKISSAHFKDIEFKDLPEKTKEEIKRFVDCSDDTKLIHAGYVLKELLGMVDKHNFDQAEKHVKDTKVDEKEFYKKLPTKYILIKYNKIIDGHHYISKAKKLGVTCSLNCLDLTPIRFQEKKSMWEKLAEELSSHKNKYNTYHTVSFKVNDYGLNGVLNILSYLKYCGSIGHSCSLEDEGKVIGSFDGDGSDRLQDIVVDEKAYHPLKREISK